jgi:hypothetical protein
MTIAYCCNYTTLHLLHSFLSTVLIATNHFCSVFVLFFFTYVRLSVDAHIRPSFSPVQALSRDSRVFKPPSLVEEDHVSSVQNLVSFPFLSRAFVSSQSFLPALAFAWNCCARRVCLSVCLSYLISPPFFLDNTPISQPQS